MCKICLQKGVIVSAPTLEHMLKPALLSSISAAQQYYFCASQDCPVAYFAPNMDHYFTKDDLVVRVGIKETDSSRTICYCFNITAEDIQLELARCGKTTIPARIKAATKSSLCACEIKNPSGRCCLGDIACVVNCTQQNGDRKNNENEFSHEVALLLDNEK